MGDKLVVYLYDATGAPIGMRYRTNSMAEGVFYSFWFDRNLQGDVVAVYNETGTKVLSYSYDAWGNKTTTVHNGSGTNGYAQYNAITYRGYYYDTETNLYYVSSRYYDANLGRWISPEPNADYGEFDGGAGLLSYNVYAYCANNPVLFKDETGESITLTCIILGAVIGAIVGGTSGAYRANKRGFSPSDGWSYWKYVVFGGVGGGALGGIAGWAFAGTNVAASISWTYYKATTAIGSSSYAIGRAFEKWFYKAYNVINQQIRYHGYRFDAIYKNSIVELKNYNWSRYSNFNSIIKSFTTQARNYMQFIGDIIAGQEIQGVTFCFSSKPPAEVIDALRSIGVTVNWLP